MKQLLILGLAIIGTQVHAQLVVQSGAILFVDAGATVTVQGDVTGNANITGTGKIIMKGSALQHINMNGYSIPNLDIDNTNHVELGGATTVTGVLNFVNGKLQLKDYAFTLGTAGTYTGAGAGKFAETNGAGEFKKLVNAVGNYTLPLGNGTDYTPLTYQLAGNTFSSAAVGGKSSGSGHPNKHPRSTDYLKTYWSLSQTGITGGTVTAQGTYVDPNTVNGSEGMLVGMKYTGGAWAIAGTVDGGANTLSAPLTTATADMYAMNKFILNIPKIFLEGPYNSGTGMMADNLRTAPAVIPTSDPYRSAPYNTAFTHVNNSVAEVIDPSVLANQANANNDIVDWVFVELRTISSPTVAPVVQTRAALVQRDGDVVDIDGKSDVYFKNVDAGNYAVSVRHRNHLGMSSNPASPLALGLNTSTYDFTTAGAGEYLELQVLIMLKHLERICYSRAMEI